MLINLHISTEPFFLELGKQCRPRSDAASDQGLHYNCIQETDSTPDTP